MAYIKEIVKAGKTIEITKRYSSRYGVKGIKRGVNINPTPDKVKKINQKNAETRLRRLINTNFQENDIHMVLTYRKDNRPDPIQAKKNLTNFLRRMKRVYEKQEIVFKYIAVTEYENTAIHHHIIMTSIDPREIQKKWKYAKARPTFLDDTGEYSNLAKYLIKETSKAFMEEDAPSKRRYTASRNLKQPTIKKEVVKADRFRTEPKPIKGYYIEKDSLRNGVNEFDGWPFQFYRMIKLGGLS